MKIKNITIIYTIFISVLFIVGLYIYNNNMDTASHLPEMHSVVTDISNQYETGIDLHTLEEIYHCDIILFDEPYYSHDFWAAVNDNSTILDLTSASDNTKLLGKIIFNYQKDAYQTLKSRLWFSILSLSICIAALGYLLIFILYFNLVRPFNQLESFATSIAKGNLDLPLPMDKTHMFGSFTESFDLMREELKLAREKEYEANRSKKELVAELSHDIKTPVATIRANCELLHVTSKEDFTKEKLSVIDTKASTIEKLIDNLFHATLEELEVLKVIPVETSSLTIEKIFSELAYYDNIHIHNSIPQCLVWMDGLRFSQVIDNIIYNSCKYAGTDIDVTFKKQPEGIIVRISDHGKGLPADELPLATQKYFRGSNTSGKTGSGLGLFLANSFMEQMKGSLTCYNDEGFVVELFLLLV